MKIGDTTIGSNHPAYFVADIAANHDGSIQRAVELIKLAAGAGANAAKFQNFSAKTIVSSVGFSHLGKLSHQSDWGKDVYSIYDEASISLEWTLTLKEACAKEGIEYFTSPYDLTIVDYLDDHVSAWKVGSGDITWLDMIRALSIKRKPLLIATGASSLDDVKRALNVAQENTKDIVLMQCNTNYTASIDNFKYVNLSVLESYSRLYPDLVLGLSDHTPGHATVLGAIALGARVIEKHFTDDPSRIGPDHKFSMSPNDWSEMVINSRRLESSMGDGIKRIEKNEQETVVVQRRAMRAKKDIDAGEIIREDLFVPLRPCPADSVSPAEFTQFIGKFIKKPIAEGHALTLDVIQ